MYNKLQYYSALAERSTGQLTKSRENWTEYLTAAARLYKYPFDEQVMIYTQKPDATACAPLETWNNPMNRKVKRGSKGIALIYQIGGESRLRYVFDYADTEGGWQGRDPRRPQIWELRQEHEVPVMDALAEAYDGNIEGTLDYMLHNIAFDLAEDYYNNNARDILYSVRDSFLDGYDEYDIKTAFCEAVTLSTGYSLMSRCGLNPDDFYEDVDFNCIFDFNTFDAVNAMGTAVSELTEQVLREIEVTVKKYEREHTAERGTEYGDKLSVHQEWGLYASQPDAQRADERTSRQIRADEADAHSETPQNPLQFSDSEREADGAFTGNRQDGEPEVRAVDGGTGSERPAAGQSGRSNGLDSSHEQPESAGGGIYPDGTDLRLENQAEGAVDETAPFSMEIPDEINGSQVGVNLPDRDIQDYVSLPDIEQSGISLDTVDAMLRDGGNKSDSVMRITAHYMKGKTPAENAAFIAREYGQGGKGLRIDGQRFTSWFDDAGFTVAEGPSALYPMKSVHLTWEQVESQGFNRKKP